MWKELGKIPETWELNYSKPVAIITTKCNHRFECLWIGESKTRVHFKTKDGYFNLLKRRLKVEIIKS